jgi:hypothetical protein
VTRDLHFAQIICRDRLAQRMQVARKVVLKDRNQIAQKLQVVVHARKQFSHIDLLSLRRNLDVFH